MASQNEGPYLPPIVAGEAIAQWDCVKINASGQLVKTTGVASEDNTLCGVAQEAIASGAYGTVRAINSVSSSKCRAASAFSAGAKVYTMTDGEVDDVSTSLTVVGVAIEAATAANDIVEVVHIKGGNDDIS